MQLERVRNSKQKGPLALLWVTPHSINTSTMFPQDKIQSYWEITKKDLERSRADVRNKDRDMEDLQEQQQIELKVLPWPQCQHMSLHEHVKVTCEPLVCRCTSKR